MSASGGSDSGSERRGPANRAKRRQEAQKRARRALAERRRLEQKRQRLQIAGIATAAVVVAALVIVVVGLVTTRDAPSPSPLPSGDEAAEIVRKTTSVPASTLDHVGKGAVQRDSMVAVSGQQPLTADGKPLVLYVGAEYCPFCASQRWAVVVALSRFGTFTDLGMTHSAKEDVHPNTPSFSFHGSSYTSQYLAFQGVELSTNERKGDHYEQLDTLTSEQERVMKKFNAPPYTKFHGSIPFMDLGNRYLLHGGAYPIEVLKGKTAMEIADVLGDPSDPVARAVLGTANMITAYTCELTGGEPGAVCSSDAVAAFKGSL